MLVQLLFYWFGLVLLAAALGVILCRNPVHSALCLVATFFTAAAIWLLVAIIAAIVLTLRHRKGLKVQDIGAQVATRREDRLRILQMPAEKKE